MQFVFGFKGILSFFCLFFAPALCGLFSKRTFSSFFVVDFVAAKFLILEIFAHSILALVNFIVLTASIIIFRHAPILDLFFYWLKASLIMLSLPLSVSCSLYISSSQSFTQGC